VKPPEVKALMVFKHLMETANLPTFLNFGNANTSWQKIMGGHKTGGWNKTGGLCLPSGPGLKPPLELCDFWG